MAKTTDINYKVNVDTTDAESSIDNLESSFDEVGGAAGGVIDQLKGVGLAMKAIATNPIGLVIAGIAAVFTTLAAAAKRNEKAMESINKVMAYFKGTIDGLLNALGPLVEFLTDSLLKAFENPMQAIKDLGQTILDNIVNRFKAVLVLGDAMSELFKGNFKEAAKLGADAMIQFGTGVENGTDKIVSAGEALADFGESIVKNVDLAIDANKKLANSELELLRIQKDFELQQLNFQKLAEDQRQIRDDTSKSIEERIAANNELSAVLNKQQETEMALAQQQLEFARLKQQADGVTLENETELLEARNKVAEINERIDSQRSEQLTNQNALIKEQTELEQKQADQKIKDAKKVADEITKAEAEAKKKQAKADKELGDIKDGVTEQTFGLIGDLADEQSVIGKGQAVAQIGVDTYKGATAALGAAPWGPWNILSAALVTASGIAAATKAAGIKMPTRKGSSASGGSAPSISASLPSAGSVPSFTDNLTDDINTDATAAAINAQSRQPLKAVVSLNDLDDATNTRNNINENATL